MASIDNVQDLSPRVQFTAIANQLIFPYPFPIFEDADIVVDIDGVLQALSTGYTVSGKGNDTGGNVTLIRPIGTELVGGEIVTIFRDIAIARATDFQQNGPWSSTTFNDELDKLHLILQELENKVGRSIRFPITSASTNAQAEMAPISNFFGKFLRITSAGILEAADLLSNVVAFTAETIGALLYPQTAAELAAGVTPTAFRFIAGNVFRYGVIGDGIVVDVVAMQRAINAASGATLDISGGTFLIDASLDFSSFTGRVVGDGTIKAKSATTISKVIDFADAINITWDGPNVDMGQTASTVDADNRSDSCFYFRDARDCRLQNCDILNIRVGEPIFIDGTSAVSSTAVMGSKRIKVHNVTCVAFEYNVVDLGAFINVRSDFQTDTVGGLYFAASNATKVADYTLDAAVALDRTTSDIQFSHCHFENFDRFAGFNSKDVYITNCKLKNFYTRGYNLSPSCENWTVDGGSISGNGAQINANFVCHDLVFANLTAEGESASVGQRHALRCGFGTHKVRFSNIIGIGNDTAQIYIEGARDIRFDGISLDDWQGGNTTIAVNITAGEDGNTSNFVTKNIVFNGCWFGANFALKFDQLSSGTATVDLGAVKITECHFEKTFQLFNGTLPTGGEIAWSNSTATKVGSAQDLISRSFSLYEGSNLNMKVWDTFNATGATTFPTFTDVFYYTTERDGGGGDDTRIPNVRAYVKKSGETFYVPLLYGEDWEIDGTNAGIMWNKIKMITAGDLANGDVVAIERIR